MQKERPAGLTRGDPKYTWDDTVAAIGKDFSGGAVQVGQEKIDYATISRFCEPWEIGNPIYWYRDVAKQAGYRGVVAPWSSIKQTFTYSNLWRPGDPPRFSSNDPNADSRWAVVPDKRRKEVPLPPHSNGLVTEVQIEFFEPACVGDRLTVKGDKVANVRVRETRIGFGAFVNRENEIFNQRGELVARVNQGNYAYISAKLRQQ